MEPEQDYTYKTLKQAGNIVLKVKGSRFIGIALPVKNESEVKAGLDKLRKMYPDATHVCYAYILGKDGSRQKSSDDGEPTGTAGRPILRQISKAGLVNTLVAVVRYFGGTLLGTGGLIQAYSSAAAEVLEACGTSTLTRYEIYRIRQPYGNEHEIYSFAAQYGILLNVIPDDSCFCAEIKIPLQYVGIFSERFHGSFSKPEHPGTE